ncbi:MAG: hypothetical protein ACRDSR_12495 [Pseudonocardiaceae bacterium]
MAAATLGGMDTRTQVLGDVVALEPVAFPHVDDTGRPLIESKENNPKEWESKTHSDGDEGQEEDCWVRCFAPTPPGFPVSWCSMRA